MYLFPPPFSLALELNRSRSWSWSSTPSGFDCTYEHGAVPRECVLSLRPHAIEVGPPVATGKADRMPRGFIVREVNIAKLLGGRHVPRSNIDAAGSDVDRQRRDVVAVPDRGLPPYKTKNVRDRCLIIQLAEQGPRSPTWSVVIKDHHIDGVSRRTVLKYRQNLGKPSCRRPDNCSA